MRHAKPIKKAEQTTRETLTPVMQRASGLQLTGTASTQVTVTQWVGAFRNSQSTNPRAAFAALFTAKGQS